MQIPQFWATHQLEFQYKNRTTQVFRFGWSDVSLDHAKQHAITRCEDARTRILAGEKFIKRTDGKDKYLDDSGLPIREKIVKKYPQYQAITTINSYGAVCLNIENVLILDIDHDYFEQQTLLPAIQHQFPKKPKEIYLRWSLILAILSVMIGKIWLNFGFWWLVLLFFMVLMNMFWLIVVLNDRKIDQWNAQKDKILNDYAHSQGGYLQILKQQSLQAFLQNNPQAVFNVYQTPKGFRLIALHDYFTASDEFTKQCFANLPVDSIYQRLCKIQQCFRARVTGKPWRMGIKYQFYGYQSFWQDLSPDCQQIHQQWLDDYQQVAKNFAACRFVEQVGQGLVNPKVADVVALHDDLCQATSDLPLA